MPTSGSHARVPKSRKKDTYQNLNKLRSKLVNNITHLQVSLNYRVGNHFLLLIFNENVEKLHVSLIGGLKDLSGGI